MDTTIGGYWAICPWLNHSRSTLILISKNLDVEFLSEKVDTQGCFVFLNVTRGALKRSKCDCTNNLVTCCFILSISSNFCIYFILYLDLC